MLQTKRVDKTIRKFTSFQEMKAEEYRYWQGRRMGRVPSAVDVMTEIPALDFDTAWSRRVEGVIDPSGLKTNFLSRDDLITTKLASGRPQDLADVDAIRNSKKAVDDDQG